eukprot:4600644-Karenia_brevis.AAC.1
MPEGSRREGKRRRPPDKDRPRGMREKNPESEFWECPRGRVGRGKAIARPIRITHGGRAKKDS